VHIPTGEKGKYKTHLGFRTRDARVYAFLKPLMYYARAKKSTKFSARAH